MSADLATERERLLTTERLNATSGTQFVALPLVKPVVWLARRRQQTFRLLLKRRPNFHLSENGDFKVYGDS